MQYTKFKPFLFWSILLMIPVIFSIGLVLGRYTYGKLTFREHFCSSFGQLDNEIGWVHKENFESCMGVHAKFNRSHVYHESAIYTDKNGFRSAQVGGDSPHNAVMFIGDSLTFSYNVPIEDSFPAIFSELTNEPIVNTGSPAYGGAQVVALTQRWVGKLKPKALVYFENGDWIRGVCKGETRPRFIMKPCYWVRPDGGAELVRPPENHVKQMAAWGLRPGGMVGVGEDTWSYFLISRPLAKIKQMLVRLGLMSGMPNDFIVVGMDGTPARRALLKDLLDIARSAKSPLILLDKIDAYGEFINELSDADQEWLLYVSQVEWTKEVTNPASLLPKNEIHVPHDTGHYAVGVNRLIAQLVKSEFAKIPQ